MKKILLSSLILLGIGITKAQNYEPYRKGGLLLHGKYSLANTVQDATGYYTPSTSGTLTMGIGYHREIVSYKKWTLHGALIYESWVENNNKIQIEGSDLKLDSDRELHFNSEQSTLWNLQFQLAYELYNKNRWSADVFIGYRWSDFFTDYKNTYRIIQFELNNQNEFEADLAIDNPIIEYKVKHEGNHGFHFLQIGGGVSLKTKWAKLRWMMQYNYRLGSDIKYDYKILNLENPSHHSSGSIISKGHELSLSLTIFPSWGEKKRAKARMKRGHY
ncbi:MAG: hypothetical protein N4A45_04695 [Flavobacteriales bacterium]|jgi:hypothetical protein|nr:hypothetical protein [Flavobacteriales bacterium]